jgi:CHASE2 domain-containing sensor protein
MQAFSYRPSDALCASREFARALGLRFRGSPGTVHRISAPDVLAGRVPATTFTDKVVVLRVVADGNADAHQTPFSGGRRLSKPEVPPDALDTLLRGSPLCDVARPVDRLDILLLAFVPALAGLIAPPALGAGTIAAVAPVFMIVALLACHGGRVFVVAAPLVALGMAAASAASRALAHTLRANDRLAPTGVDAVRTTGNIRPGL